MGEPGALASPMVFHYGEQLPSKGILSCYVALSLSLGWQERVLVKAILVTPAPPSEITPTSLDPSLNM